MLIRVLLFGILKNAVGQDCEVLDLPAGACVHDVLVCFSDRFPEFAALAPALAVAVNQEYSRSDRALAAGDEVALLPPVSGGGGHPFPCTPGEIRIGREPISTLETLNRLKRPENGAVVIFEGIVRDNSRGRPTLYLDYEAYEPMALKQLQGLAEQARERFGVGGVSIIHRIGRLQIGETSVLIAVASAHRSAAFDACRWLIDTLKKTVPIWKKEHFEDGAVWADGDPFPAEIHDPGGATGQPPASK